MTLTKETVIDALRFVEDPELHRSIIELDMVRGVVIDEGAVRVEVALTVAGCPMRAEITERVTSAVAPLAGVHSVDVDMTVMTPEELNALRDKLGVPAGRQEAGEVRTADLFPNGRIFGISSGKGGVGKSSVTVNLAITLAKRGKRVGILDADIYGFSVPQMLGLSGELFAENDKVIPPEAFGVQCISLGFFVDDNQAVMWRGPMLHKALEQFLVDVAWNDLEYLFIDMPPGTGDVALSMSEYVPKSEIIVVTTPQPAAQRVAQRSGVMAREMKLPVIGVIENMAWFTGDDGKRYELFGTGGGGALASSLGAPLLGKVPLVPALREGGDTGRPITIADPESEAAQAFEALANAIEATSPKRVYKPELRITTM